MNTICKRLLALIAVLGVMVTIAAGCAKDASKDGDTTAPTTTAATTLPPTTTTAVNGVMEGEVYVRTGPGSQYDPIGGVLLNEGVTIVGREGDWYKIRFADTYGYVNAHYVAVEGQPNASMMQEERPKATTTTAFKAEEFTVSGETAKVYAASGSQDEAMGELKKDTVVTVTGKDGDWYEIEYQGGIGYVKAEDVTKGTTTTVPSSTGTGVVTTTTGKNGIPNTNADDALN